MPQATERGMIPTLNNKGFMSIALDPVSTAFTKYAGETNGWSLDLGCAYGIATLAALDRGAHIIACDMEPRHLQVLLSKVHGSAKERVHGLVAKMPQIAFQANSYDAVLCSRALHFLTGNDVEATVSAIADWLKPGGKVFLVVDTPYTGFWAKGAARYEEKKANGEHWPGFIPDVRIYLSDKAQTKNAARYLNPMDPDILARVSVNAGLLVEQAAFSGRPDNSNDRAHAGVIAMKPK